MGRQIWKARHGEGTRNSDDRETRMNKRFSNEGISKLFRWERKARRAFKGKRTLEVFFLCGRGRFWRGIRGVGELKMK